MKRKGGGRLPCFPMRASFDLAPLAAEGTVKEEEEEEEEEEDHALGLTSKINEGS